MHKASIIQLFGILLFLTACAQVPVKKEASVPVKPVKQASCCTGKTPPRFGLRSSAASVAELTPSPATPKAVQ